MAAAAWQISGVRMSDGCPAAPVCVPVAPRRAHLDRFVSSDGFNIFFLFTTVTVAQARMRCNLSRGV